MVSVGTLALAVGTKRTLAGLHQTYEQLADQTLARSSFYGRFTPELARLFRGLAIEAVASMEPALRMPQGHLAQFTELLAMDATVVRLHNFLASKFPATRTNHTKAAAKLHVVMRVCDGSPARVKLTCERTGDSVPWRYLGRWVAGRLLLFDLGYYDFSLFDRIDQNEGFFVSRAKSNFNGLIVAAHRTWRGRSIDVVGKKVQEILPLLQRGVLDVAVRVSFKTRAYRGKRRTKTRTLRLVALRNDETGGYPLSLTNVPPERLPAEEVGITYTLRWQVELLFKAMRSFGNLGTLPSEKEPTVRCLVWASLLAAVCSQALYRNLRDEVSVDRHMPLLRWAALFARVAHILLRLLHHPDRLESRRLRRMLLRQTPDPNRNRKKRAFPQPPVRAAAA